MALLPSILSSEQVELRRWSPEFAPSMLLAIEESITELRLWMPWAMEMPTEEGLSDVLEQGHVRFQADSDWEYALFEHSSDEVVGCAGIHRTEQPKIFEIGYWVRTSRTGLGVATSATRTLTAAVFEHIEEAEQVIIAMDRANAASASIPRKLGFELIGTEDREIVTEGHTGQGLVWALDRPKP